jgi:hypothetical protein
MENSKEVPQKKLKLKASAMAYACNPRYLGDSCVCVCVCVCVCFGGTKV